MDRWWTTPNCSICLGACWVWVTVISNLDWSVEPTSHKWDYIRVQLNLSFDFPKTQNRIFRANISFNLLKIDEASVLFQLFINIEYKYYIFNVSHYILNEGMYIISKILLFNWIQTETLQLYCKVDWRLYKLRLLLL